MTLRRFNHFLTLVVVTLGLYAAVAPFLPQVFFWLRPTEPSITAPYTGVLAETVGNNTPQAIPNENRIVIPSLSINEPILEGTSIGVISGGGTWRRPNTSTPDQGGNTVIVGHRYYGSRAATFYHLDKLQVGELLAVYWEGTEKLYRVDTIQTVPADAITVEAPSATEKLTLYTCTPLWTATNRLVITALPFKEADEQQ